MVDCGGSTGPQVYFSKLLLTGCFFEHVWDGAIEGRNVLPGFDAAAVRFRTDLVQLESRTLVVSGRIPLLQSHGQFAVTAATAPEPATLALCTVGVALLAWRRRQKGTKSNIQRETASQ